MATQKRKCKKVKKVLPKDKDSCRDELDDDSLVLVDSERGKDAKEKNYCRKTSRGKTYNV